MMVSLINVPILVSLLKQAQILDLVPMIRQVLLSTDEETHTLFYSQQPGNRFNLIWQAQYQCCIV